MAAKDGEMFMTRSFNVTPKTTEKHLIAHGDKYVAYVTNNTRSLAVAERPRDVSCLTVVSFNIPTAWFFLPVTAASDLLVHKIHYGWATQW